MKERESKEYRIWKKPNHSVKIVEALVEREIDTEIVRGEIVMGDRDGNGRVEIEWKLGRGYRYKRYRADID